MGDTNFEKQDKQQLEMDYIDEQLDVIGQAFLGQTLGCARCHDHKFDPIPTKDYYALAGIFRRLWHCVIPTFRTGSICSALFSRRKEAVRSIGDGSQGCHKISCSQEKTGRRCRQVKRFVKIQR